MPRGGSRQGTPGAQYPNRSDLQQNPANTTVPRALPVTVPPSAQYGQGVTLANAQKQIPTANAPLPSPSPIQTAPGSQDPTAPTGSPAPTPGPLPGSLGQFAGPTANPAEHVMTGVPSGPGPGPEALNPTPASQQTVGAFLTSLASQPGAPADIQALAALTRSRQ